MPQTVLTHDEALNRFNSQHFLAMIGGKWCVVTDNRPDDRPAPVQFVPLREFVSSYDNEVVPVDGKLENAVRWINKQSEARRFRNGLRFDPCPTDSDRVRGQYNLFRGFKLQPDAAQPWPKIEHFLREVIAAGDPALYAWVLQWLAWLRRKPNQTCLALALRSTAKGTGKGTFAKLVQKLIGGEHFQTVHNGEHLTGKFNGCLENTLLAFVDEATWSGDKRAGSILKAMITEPYLTVESKYQNSKTVPNFVHILIASNAKWAVLMEIGDRRYVICEVSESFEQNHEYFGALRAEIEAGGAAGLLAHLMTLDLPEVMRKPVSYQSDHGAIRQLVQSLAPSEKWLYGCLKEGRTLASRDDLGWIEEVGRNDLYLDHLGEAQITSGHGFQLGREEFARLMEDVMGAKLVRSWASNGDHRPYVFRMPTLDAARTAAALYWKQPQMFAGLDDPLLH